MNDPSMKSGESIVLMTHRVNLNGVLYNMILTTQRLILVDSGETMSEPLTIPLVLIQAAKAADGFGGEPLLVLALVGEESTVESGAVNLSFPQHFGEDRSHERNDWIKKLNKHIAYARGETVFSKLCASAGHVIRLFGAVRSADGAPDGRAVAPPPPITTHAGSPDSGALADRKSSPEEKLPAAATVPPAAGSPPSPAPRRVMKHTIVTVVLFLIIIVGMAAGVFFLSGYFTAGNRDTRPPVIVPESAVQQVPEHTTVSIPKEGTWVRVDYNGTFVGWVGAPGSLRHVGGSGEQLYRINNDAGYIQASFQKQDNSGKTLTVEVYFGGAMTYQRTVRSPMGEIAFLIDPRTAEIPRVTAADNQTGK